MHGLPDIPRCPEGRVVTAVNLMTFSKIRHIAFDADDTLWKNEDFYHATEVDFGRLLDPFVGSDVARRALAETESNNMRLLGYGAKALTISLMETAARLVPDHLDAGLVREILAIGTRLLRMPTVLLPDALETVSYAMTRAHVFILTKGDLLEQERKFDNSPFKAMGLEYVVISGKEPDDYRKQLGLMGIAPSSFLMVGNSPRSDIRSPLAIGACAAYIPYTITWAHEHVDLEPDPRLIRLDRLGDLKRYL